MGGQGPRIAPLEAPAWSEEVQHIMGPLADGGTVLNALKTWAHHPQQLRRWLVFANRVLFKSTLPDRDRDLQILGTAWCWDSDYERAHHARVSFEAGMAPEEVERIREGPTASVWSPRDRVLLQAVDELRATGTLSEETWEVLARLYDPPRLLDLLFTVGQCTLVARVLKALMVDPDEPRPPGPTDEEGMEPDQRTGGDRDAILTPKATTRSGRWPGSRRSP